MCDRGQREDCEPRYAGGERRTKRLERQDGGEFGTPLRAMGGQKEREGSRGGESEAKALAGAGRGAVRAQRGGAAATTRGAPHSRTA